jgi:Transcription factor e(y)2.
MAQPQDELDQIKSQIQEHLISSGNYDIINKQLKLQLYESGWFDKVSQLTNQELQENNNGTNFDQLFAFVRPRAEELVPATVKEDILEKIKDYLDGIIQ